MKRIAIVLAVVFVLALTMSSCNKDACPAYSNADTKTEHIV